MIEIEARLDELEQLGLARRTRLVSGPQGPRVVLDGKPVLLLCSNNYLGLADHPAVREAAADAAMRWGVGAGASRLVSGTMTIHRRLEERLAAFERRQAALVFGSGYLANVGVVSALARAGDVVFSDELNHASIVDGCRLSRADVFIYEHGDVEHLEWGLREAEGRGSLIVTDGVFSMDGDVAPLPELVELAQRYDVRLMVDEAHGTGTLGPGGRGAVAEAGCEDGVDVVVGTLGKALGSYGAYVACDQQMARYLVNSSRSLVYSTAPGPPAVAGALAALSLLEEQPRRVEKLQANAALLRAELAAAGFEVDADARTPIVPLVFGEAELALRTCEKALERGVFAQAIRPPTVPAGTSRLRLAVMASHSKSELRDAARALAQAATAAGVRPEELRARRAPEPLERPVHAGGFHDHASDAAGDVPPPPRAAAAAVGADRRELPVAADGARRGRVRPAALWDDGDGELWVERRRPAAGSRPYDGERDSRRVREPELPVASAIFDAEAPGALVEHAA
jgi:glycine C-acetyltransferase/8-amino-7-oxononanoate synthase